MSKLFNNYTDKQVEFIREKHLEGYTWAEIAEEFNEKYEPMAKKSSEAMRKTHRRYDGLDLHESVLIDNVRTVHSTKRQKSKVVQENRAILDYLDKQDEIMERLEECLKANPPVYHKPVKKVSKKKTKRTIVAHLSDTHFAANIDGEEMGGLNSYTNVEEARRLAFFTKEIGGYKTKYREETDLVIAVNADIIQGVLRDLDSTVPLTTQFSTALHLLTQHISYLSNKFNKVKVIMTTGNHGRAMHRPDKGRPTKNRWDGYSTMINVAIRYAMRDHKNVEFDIPTTPFWYGKIQGHDYFIVHSDAVLNTGSIGKTVSVDSIKNKINDLASGIGNIDVVMAGHTHVPLNTVLNNGVHLLCNGNLSGVDEFCLSLGIVTNHPSQQLFEVTEKHAVGDLRNVMVLEADEMDELDKIIKPFVGKF